MTGWEILADELRHWETAGRTAELWWRDDDAVADTPALRRLLDIARVPIGLAVIPGRLEPSLAPLLAGHGNVAVLQHGWRHQNHEPAGAKKSELGPSRDLVGIGAELTAGWRILETAFGDQLLPVLTPPWNRISEPAIAALPEWGYHGISTYLARRQIMRIPGVLQVNTHVDVIDWHGGGGFVGTEAALDRLVGHLQARRGGAAELTEPTGILTHHLVHDGETWDFLMHLQDWLSKRPMIRWVPTGELFRRNVAGSNWEEK